MPSARQLAAIMFTDLVGYTALMQKNELLAKQVRDRSKKIFEEGLEKHAGRLLQNYGDGTLSIFNSALEAVKCAIHIQTQNRQDAKIDMRIGLHLGDVMFDDAGIYGDAVNVASRIESLATPGSVFISEKLYEEIRNHSIEVKSLGFFELKNVQQPVNVYAVAVPGIVVPSREEVKGKVKQTLNSIAVLPFSSLSSDPENEYFCDGITEELLNVLAKIEGLQVTSRTSSFAFKGKNEDVREIAAKLNVQKILEGSVRKTGNKVRITAQLINSADGYHLWSETYDRSLEDIFALQDDIAREIANKLRINLGIREYNKTLVKPPTQNMEAYMKYLKAISLWRKSDMSGLVEGIKLFEEASALDPEFVDPYCQLAFLAYVRAENGMLTPADAAIRCRNAAEAAIQKDPEHPLSWLASAIYKTFFAFKWSEARRDFERSLAINPNNSFAWSMFSILRNLTLDYSNLDEYAQNIKNIDPLDPISNGMIANLYLFSGQLDKAEQLCNDFARISPEGGYITMIGIFVNATKYGWQTVIPVLEQFKETGAFAMLMGVLGAAYAATGETTKAEACIDWFKMKEAESPGVVLDHVLIIYGQLGRTDEFISTVERGFANKSIIPFWVYNSFFLPESLRTHDILKDLRRRVGLPL